MRISTRLMTSITETIRSKVTSSLHPSVFEIVNNSHLHKHHQPMQSANQVTETHFKLTVVSDEFDGKNMPARHRILYSLLKDELAMQDGIHALELETRTPAEWTKKLEKTSSS